MATLQRSIGRRAIRHAVVSSKEHKADVAENNRRRSLYWVGVEQKNEDNHRVVPELGEGLYFVRDHPLFGAHDQMQTELQAELGEIGKAYALKREVPGADLNRLEQDEKKEIAGAKRKRREEFAALKSAEDSGDLLQVEGDELISRLDCWEADLSYYFREVSDPKCKAGRRWKRTPTKGIQGHVATCGPVWSKLIFEAAANEESEKVREFSTKAAIELAQEYQKRTHRRVVSLQAHFDTSSLHFHLFSTRIGSDHRLIPGTTKKFGLIGPWACGVLGQGEDGYIPQESTNYKQAKRLHDRTGGPPLDWVMCKLVDGLCQAFFGASPRLTTWRRLYMQGLPQMALERLIALRGAVDREIGQWRSNGDHTPTGVGFQRGPGGMPGREVTF